MQNISVSKIIRRLIGKPSNKYFIAQNDRTKAAFQPESGGSKLEWSGRGGVECKIETASTNWRRQASVVDSSTIETLTPLYSTS